MVNLTVNGVVYAYPNTGDASWGDVTTNWATAVTNSMLQKTGGLFTLTADVNFGTSFGLIAPYFISSTTNPSLTGNIRLAKTDTVSFRNNANSADLAIGIDGSNNLTFNGAKVISAGLGSIVNEDINAAAAIVYSKLNLTGSILSSDLSTFISKAKGGTGQDNSTLIFPASGTLTENAATQTLTNKTLTSPSVTGTLASTGGFTFDNSGAGISYVVGLTASPFMVKSAAGNSNGLRIFNDNATNICHIVNGYNANLILGANNTDYLTLAATGSLTQSVASSGGVGPVLLLKNNASSAGSNAARLVLGTDTLVTTTSGGVQLDGINTNAGNGAADLSVKVWSGSANTEYLRISNAGLLTLGASGGSQTHVANGNVSVVAQSATPLTLQGIGSSGVLSTFKNGAASGKYNWAIGNQFNVNNGFEITPSTLVDGTTFTTPVATFAATGVAIKGTTTNDSATAGFVGEFQEAILAAGAWATATSTTANVTSKSLTAGDWLITGIVYSSMGSAGSLASTISSLTTTTGAAGTLGDTSFVSSNLNGPTSVCVASKRFSLASTTTVYLTASLSYTGTNPTVGGRITAIRIR